MVYIGDKKVEASKIEVIDFRGDEFQQLFVETAKGIQPFIDRDSVTWVNVAGLHEVERVESIGKLLDLHPLVMEDIINTEQRAKIEIFDDYIFIAMKLFNYDAGSGHVRKDQLSIILAKNCLFTFQEVPETILDPLRQRIRNASGRIRKNGPDYLLYAILDIVIDHYAYVLENLHDVIEDLEEAVLRNDAGELLQQIHFLKNETIGFRKTMWPVREIISTLTHDDHPLLQEHSDLYFRDVADHLLHASESVDTLRERLTGLMDIYLNQASNRMNEVMKVLTIIATIFIPLSFLTGVYGMNFEYFPELKWHFGYAYFWGASLLMSLGMLRYFKRKRWF